MGAVAIIAVGPKDMPKVMHAFGRWVGKMRAFTRDIGTALDKIAAEAEAAQKTNSNASSENNDRP